jgi:hypothetical protein
MQTIVQVVCSKGSHSLRDKIVNDPQLSEFGLSAGKKQQAGRRPGWAKIHNLEGDGTLNIVWHADTSILTGRIVNRLSGRPAAILGNFVRYLFHHHRRQIRAVNIVP